ncbi:MAG: 50S ribosomal protein L15 [Planctomycetes bacterium]|nr:50S ribosomal protein L15 [Planctomycetota bacterium]
MNLSDIKRVRVPRKRAKRVGRGRGSGAGRTSGRGQKGYGAREGNKGRTKWLEGGQMPLYRRLPKRGFSNARYRKVYVAINVGALNAFRDGAVVDAAALQAVGLVGRSRGVGLKVLGTGDLVRRVTVRAHGFSRVAQEKIAAAGGKAERLEGPSGR